MCDYLPVNPHSQQCSFALSGSLPHRGHICPQRHLLVLRAGLADGAISQRLMSSFVHTSFVTYSTFVVPSFFATLIAPPSGTLPTIRTPQEPLLSFA